MRQLRPQIVEERKKRVLQWVIHRYIKTSVPVASQAVAEEAGMELSSASIRNLFKELETEGYLCQPHTSAGRVPTDKGYRFYVDYIADVQRLASEEKERIERRYDRRIAELDRLLSETSKLLSHASRSAGLVLSPKVERHTLRRIDLIPMGRQQVLAVLVTQSGLIRHWPIALPSAPGPAQLQRLNRFLNEQIQDKSVGEALAAVHGRLEQAERELRELGLFAERLLEQLGSADEPGELYMEGATQILSRPEELGDLDEMQSLIQALSGKRALAELLAREMEEATRSPRDARALVQVRIGKENRVPALKNLSLVATTYRFQDKVVGVLGILGGKRMEYSRMMGLVNHVSDVVSRSLEALAEEEE